MAYERTGLGSTTPVSPLNSPDANGCLPGEMFMGARCQGCGGQCVTDTRAWNAASPCPSGQVRETPTGLCHTQPVNGICQQGFLRRSNTRGEQFCVPWDPQCNQPVLSCPSGKAQEPDNRSRIIMGSMDTWLQAENADRKARGCRVISCGDGRQTVTCCDRPRAQVDAPPPPPSIVYTTPLTQTVRSGQSPLFWIGLGLVGVGLIMVSRGRS
jgi:hypothetical protein